MARVNWPAVIIAGVAGLCVSAAAGAGFGNYCASGINPIGDRTAVASAYADDPPLPDAGTRDRDRDRGSLDQFSEAAVRHLTDQAVTDRTDDNS